MADEQSAAGVVDWYRRWSTANAADAIARLAGRLRPKLGA
jgi:hypothetical protein